MKTNFIKMFFTIVKTLCSYKILCSAHENSFSAFGIRAELIITKQVSQHGRRGSNQGSYLSAKDQRTLTSQKEKADTKKNSKSIFFRQKVEWKKDSCLISLYNKTPSLDIAAGDFKLEMAQKC